MEESIQNKAREQALLDWQNKSAVYMVPGRLALNQPVLSKKQIFYPHFYPCKTSGDEIFCHVYNETLNELVQNLGIPEWAPIKRIPEQSVVLEVLAKTGQHISTFVHESIRERNLVRSVLGSWSKGQPVTWSRFPAKEILLIAGNITQKADRVDVLDTEDMRWLATFEFHRKDYPRMPWEQPMELNNTLTY